MEYDYDDFMVGDFVYAGFHWFGQIVFIDPINDIVSVEYVDDFGGFDVMDFSIVEIIPADDW